MTSDLIQTATPETKTFAAVFGGLLVAM